MATHPPARGPEEPENPYVAPKAPLHRPVDELGYPPLRFGVAEVLDRSWAIYRSRMGFCIGAVVGWFAIYLGVLTVLGAANPILLRLVGDARVAGLIAIGLIAAIGIVVAWLQVGLTIVMLKLARGRLASFGDLFSGGPHVVPTILAGLILGLLGLGFLIAAMVPILLVAAIAGRDPATQVALMIAGSVAGLLALFAISLRLSQFPYAIIERGVGPVESLRISSRATSGRWASLLLLFLIAGLINLSGALALGVGLIFTMPLSLLILAVTYTALVAAPGRQEPDPRRDF